MIWTYLVFSIFAIKVVLPLCSSDCIVHNVFDYLGHHTNNTKQNIIVKHMPFFLLIEKL